MPAIDEIRRTLREVSIDLDYAVAFYETFVPTGQDAALIDRINKLEFYPAFNVISDSLHQSAIVALCRIWDRRRDTADLNSLADAFDDATVIAGHAIDPAKLSLWLSEVDAVNKSNELAALKRARHRGIAHRATPNSSYQGPARIARYGDERKIIEKTIPLVEQAGAFVGYSYAKPYADQRDIRHEHAAKFWAAIR